MSGEKEEKKEENKNIEEKKEEKEEIKQQIIEEEKKEKDNEETEDKQIKSKHTLDRKKSLRELEFKNSFVQQVPQVSHETIKSLSKLILSLIHI